MNLHKYGQYKQDIFEKLDFLFKAGSKILDVGCGDCSDAVIFIDEYNLKTYGIDIYKHENVDHTQGLDFKEVPEGIYKIPYPDESFDYIFLHDVLHHIDEVKQSREKHIAGLLELKRVCRRDGVVIIVEGNRYNPLFYPHMVKMRGHNHFRQSYFKSIIEEVFPNYQFKTFESHLYPPNQLAFWKFYEYIMEHFVPPAFRAYNVAICKKND